MLDSRLYFPLMSKPNRNFHNPPSNDYQSPTPRRAYTHSAVNLENNSKKGRRKDKESTQKEQVKDEPNTATTRQRHGNKSKEKADKEQTNSRKEAKKKPQKSRKLTGDAGVSPAANTLKEGRSPGRPFRKQ
ncbi:MAG: hypothetical protein ACI30J_03880 [Paludibacteraceae bacterium]